MTNQEKIDAARRACEKLTRAFHSPEFVKLVGRVTVTFDEPCPKYRSASNYEIAGSDCVCGLAWNDHEESAKG